MRVPKLLPVLLLALFQFACSSMPRLVWNLDPVVESFLKQHPAAGNLIILTTSGDGDWLPKKQTGQYDAVSAASEMADVEKTAAKLIQKIDPKIK